MGTINKILFSVLVVVHIKNKLSGNFPFHFSVFLSLSLPLSNYHHQSKGFLGYSYWEGLKLRMPFLTELGTARIAPNSFRLHLAKLKVTHTTLLHQSISLQEVILFSIPVDLENPGSCRQVHQLKFSARKGFK